MTLKCDATIVHLEREREGEREIRREEGIESKGITSGGMTHDC